MSIIDWLFGKKKEQEPVVTKHVAEQQAKKAEMPTPNPAPPAVIDNPGSNYIFRHACSCGTELTIEVRFPIQAGAVSCAKCGTNYHYRTAERGYIFIDGVNLRYSEKKDGTAKSNSSTKIVVEHSYQANTNIELSHQKSGQPDVDSIFREAEELSKTCTFQELKLVVEKYAEVINRNPDHVEAHFGRARCYHVLSEFDLAIKDYSVVINRTPDNAEAYFRRAKIYFTIGQVYMHEQNFEAALSDIDHAISLKPDYVDAFSLKGAIYKEEKNYDNAIENATAAIAISNVHYDAHLLRGECYLIKGLHEEALQDFLKCKEINPNIGNPDDFIEKMRIIDLRKKLQPLNHKFGRQISSNDVHIVKNALKTAPILSDAKIKQITENKPIWKQNHFESSLDKVCEDIFSRLSKDFAHHKFIEATALWDKETSEFVEILCFYQANNPSGGLFIAHIITRKGDDIYCLWYTKRDLDRI